MVRVPEAGALSADQEVRRALAARADFYKPWGDVTGVRFDDWWRDHGRLFEERRQVRRLARREAPSDPDAIAIEVPLTPSMVTIMRQVRAVVREAREGRVRGARRTRPAATYRLTEGAEPRFRALRDSLTVYREVYLKCLKDPELRGKEPRGKTLLDAAHAYYAGRKRMNSPCRSGSRPGGPDGRDAKPKALHRERSGSCRMLPEVSFRVAIGPSGSHQPRWRPEPLTSRGGGIIFLAIRQP